jgi:hypothetical protein
MKKSRKDKFITDFLLNLKTISFIETTIIAPSVVCLRLSQMVYQIIIAEPAPLRISLKELLLENRANIIATKCVHVSIPLLYLSLPNFLTSCLNW